MEFAFNVSPKVLLGPGMSKMTGACLKENGAQKLLFICDNNLVKLGLTSSIVEGLNDAGIETVIFDKVQGEPPYTLVIEAAELAKTENVDALVGMGGGSALDTAKAVNILLGNQGEILEYADTFDAVENRGKYLVLIPTTFGTGSEVTDGCVLSVPEENKKITLWGKNISADLALIDPELALGLPASITASTGMDALSHAVEAYTSPGASPVSDMVALEAIKIILGFLSQCVQEGKNLENRAQMCLGCLLAGIAFNNGGLNQGHELAHALGGAFHIPHGTACAISLPLAIAANAKAMPERIRTLAKLFGVACDNLGDVEISFQLVERMVELRKELGIPGLKEVGITETDFERIGDAWDREPKGEYAFAPAHEYIVEFVKKIY